MVSLAIMFNNKGKNALVLDMNRLQEYQKRLSCIQNQHIYVSLDIQNIQSESYEEENKVEQI